MPKVTLKGGVVEEYPSGIKIYEIAAKISEGLFRNACAATVDGKLCDLRDEITEDCQLEILTFEDELGKWAYRHTAAHIMAQAVSRIYPGTLFAIGPATDEGFYYDFDHYPFSSDGIKGIEKEMKKIIAEDIKIERFTMNRQEAIEYYEKKGEIYKLELIRDLPDDAVISFYKQGDFTDLCAGPHLMSTKGVKAVKLYSDGGSSGAYWRGSEKNKMLSRIYGTAFSKTSDLEAYLKRREEARKRDHNKVGRELKIFTTSEPIGQGLPLLMPKGAKIFQLLQRFVEDEEERRGYVLTKTPYMAKSDLYKISGHWDHYQDGMFILRDDDDVFALRPMTCPFQFSIYNAEPHSYKDLPIRYGETSTLFRNESSGEMHGLIRVRQFTISEGHLVCTRDQVGEEFKGVFELGKYMLDTLGFKDDISFQLSLWDPDNKEKYVGDPQMWEEIQDYMRDLMGQMGLEYKEAIGEAAFYGPKLDIQIKNVYGKEDTLITIQIDFSLAERFNMTYVDKDGSKVHPLVIHRTSIGCYERTIALLIEKYGGAFPTWLAPTQVKILPISDKFADYALKVQKQLVDAGLRAVCDMRAEKIGYKIREARNERTPYIIVVGEKEQEEGSISLRSRAKGDEGSVLVSDLLPRLLEEIKTMDLSAALPTAINLR